MTGAHTQAFPSDINDDPSGIGHLSALVTAGHIVRETIKKHKIKDNNHAVRILQRCEAWQQSIVRSCCFPFLYLSVRNAQ